MPRQNELLHNWPGWSLKENPFGNEFDQAARERMIQGSRLLLPFILKYKEKLNNQVCEIGPFFNPLLNHPDIKKEFSDITEITFIENDKYAINYLEENINCKIWEIDLNNISLFDNNSNNINFHKEKFFDLIIVSQVLNYVDYNNLLEHIFTILKFNGLVLINNSIDYGLPSLFSNFRPRKNEDLVNGAIKANFNVIEHAILPKANDFEHTERLIMVLSKQ